MSLSKTSATVIPSDSSSERTMTAAARAAKLSVNTNAASGRLTLHQATRVHMDTSLGKRKESGGAKARSSNSKPQPLTGILGLSTCNSTFLNNLLADVAKAKEDILRAQGNDVSAPAIKRRRISMEQNSNVEQPTNKPYVPPPPANFLDLLWEESWLAPPDLAAMNPSLNQRPAVAPVAPPRPTLIPATVSETFPQEELERKPSSTATDIEAEEFGWYVDMDEDDDSPGMSDDSHRFGTHNATKGSSSHDLAFSAPTAPRASNYDAEIEWAKAADTVDDVLGNLF